MKVLAAAATVATLLVAGGCGSDEDRVASQATSPEDAVSRLLSALETGSCADVQQVVVTPDAVDCEMIGTLRGGYADDGVDLDDVELRSGEVVDGSATVTVHLGGDEADETWQAEQVDGDWKVLFDSEE